MKMSEFFFWNGCELNVAEQKATNTKNFSFIVAAL